MQCFVPFPQPQRCHFLAHFSDRQASVPVKTGASVAAISEWQYHILSLPTYKTRQVCYGDSRKVRNPPSKGEDFTRIFTRGKTGVKLVKF